MRRTGMELLDPGKTALLVIDVQVGLFASDPPPFEGDLVLKNIRSLLDRARSAKATVIFIQHDGTAEDDLEPGTAGWQLHPELEVQPQETVLRKTTCDAFYRTELESLLRCSHVDTLILTGYATDFCIDSTLRNAVSKEFQVMVAADAHTTNDSPTMRAALTRNHLNWAWENCTTAKPVRVLPSCDLLFPAQV